MGEATDASEPGPAVLVQTKGAIAFVTLNRPKALNAADRELHRDLAVAWEQVADEESVHAVVFTGSGRAFCAGGDLDLIAEMSEHLEVRSAVLDETEAIIRTMLRCPVPIIAAVNGPAIGFGCSLVALCDVVVMSEKAFFADPHVVFGLTAGDGGAVALPFLMGLLRAKAAILLGERINAAEALATGLATKVVAPEDLESTTLAIAEQFASTPRQALTSTKAILNDSLNKAMSALLPAGLEGEAASFDAPAMRAKLQALG